MVVKKGTLSVSLYEGAPSTIYTVWEFIEDVENLIVMRNEAFPSEQAKAYAGIDVSEIASIFDSAQYPDPICTWDVELTPVSEESESVDVNLIPNASVDCNLVDTSVSNVILKSKTIYIPGTSITTHHNSSNFYYTGEAAVNGNQPTTHKDSVCVTQVIGWK